MRDRLQALLHDRYLIERELGHGGMGTVYLAQDMSLQRSVAIKVLPPDLAVREELRERFLRETRMAASFSHPNIVPVHAVEEHPDLLCFVMGFIEGETLGQRIRRGGPLTATEAIRLLQEVAWALSYAHGRGVIHRDVKPDNILIERATGRALVTDFGIAHSTSTPGGNTLTRVGEVVGTPQFMSPEQAAGEKTDGRSDLYSLGVVAFFAVTGRLPFEAESVTGVMAMHITQPPPKVASLRSDLPAGLRAAIDRCLDKDPATRFQSGEELAASLDVLRSSRREIAPSVRLFQTQCIQSVRTILIIVALEVIYNNRVSGMMSFLDQAFPVIIGAAVAWGIIGQMTERARSLLSGGFSFADVRAGMAAIMAERAEARAQERADPRARKRAAKRWRIIIGGPIYSVLTTVWVFKSMRSTITPTIHTITVPGVILLASAAVMSGLVMALIVMYSLRATVFDRFATWIWSGTTGRLIFRLAARGVSSLAGDAAMMLASTASSPRAMLINMPPKLRRNLRDADTRIKALEVVMRDLADRQRSIDDAIAEAGTATPGGDTALRSRHSELLGDFSRARTDIIARRERLAGVLENVRLQLLRVKSGLGSPSDVVAELITADAVIGGSLDYAQSTRPYQNSSSTVKSV
jgi:eukaryotic-like serine/threonine-protein kinase